MEEGLENGVPWFWKRVYTSEGLRIKGNLIYADKIRLLDDADLKWWNKAMPNITRSPFNGSHMFPFEKPKELAGFINKIVATL